MKNSDGRKINRKTLETIRMSAVKRVEAGESPEIVIKSLGFTRSQIYEWLSKYREGGIDALRSHKAPGKPPKLTGNQRQKIYRLVVGVDPRQLKFESALWTRGMVRELIWRKFKVKLSDVSVGRLLKKLGLTPQGPLHRTLRRNEISVFKWMTEDFIAIRKLAKKHNAEIFFADESSVRTDYDTATTWAQTEETPVVKSNNTQHRANLLSAINPRGTMRFMVTEGDITFALFIEFLKRLLHKQTRPMFLILDNHSVHRSREIRQFVDSTEGKIRLFFLPQYFPELNPDEHVWNYLKSHKPSRQTTGSNFEIS